MGAGGSVLVGRFGGGGGVAGAPEVEALADHFAEVGDGFLFAGLAADGGAVEVEVGVDGADHGGDAAAFPLAGGGGVGDVGAEDDGLAGEELGLRRGWLG